MIDFDRSSLSAENDIPARVLQLRAQIALGQADQVIASVQKKHGTPDFAAVKAFALHANGNTKAGLQEIEELLRSAPGNATVQILGGTVLQAAGKSEEALAVLKEHQGNLEA